MYFSFLCSEHRCYQCAYTPPKNANKSPEDSGVGLKQGDHNEIFKDKDESRPEKQKVLWRPIMIAKYCLYIIIIAYTLIIGLRFSLSSIPIFQEKVMHAFNMNYAHIENKDSIIALLIL